MKIHRQRYKVPINTTIPQHTMYFLSVTMEAVNLSFDLAELEPSSKAPRKVHIRRPTLSAHDNDFSDAISSSSDEG